jgi:RNA polymerase sigma factor (sigma-70 family)
VVRQSEVNAAVLEQNTLDAAQTVADAPQLDSNVPPGDAVDVDDLDVGALYIEHRTLLQFVAARKFRIPESEAENLIQDVFLSFLQQSGRVTNVRSWLVAAICNASRHYWRAQGRTESLPDDIGERCDPHSSSIADRLALEMTMHQSIGYLSAKCQHTLHLHYFEGRSASDVARELNTTSRYAEKMIHNCLKRVRDVYMHINRVTR